MLKLFESARRVSVPLVVVTTADQAATIEAIREQTGNGLPIVRWDAACGMRPLTDMKTDPGQVAMTKAGIKSEHTIGFTEAMMAAQLLPQGTILFALNAHRQLQSQEPQAVAAAIQAVANLRDPYKRSFRTLVLLAPALAPIPELSHDVMIVDHALPTVEELGVIVTETHASAKELKPMTKEATAKAVDAVGGLTAFEAEQNMALSLTTDGLDIRALWERKRATIELTRGLSVYRGKETLDDLRGLSSVKARLRQHVSAKTPVGVVVWIDEGADVFSNVENDTSGVKTDQQRALLVEMEQQNWRGLIAVGVPGSGKSAIARAFGNEAGVPTVSVDFGDMEGPHVGESEAMLRSALKVIKSVGRGNAFFVLTCNSLKGIRPQFQRRFRRGVFFFDLPTAEERAAIWALYEKRYELKPQPRPDDDGWTGSEIEECCKSAWDTGVTLAEAAQYIIPVSRSRAAEIEEMRKEANGRFLDASHPGAYQYQEAPMAHNLRAIALPRTKKEAVN